MLKIHKNYVLDDEKNPVAVQIPISEFEHLEEVIENYGLSRMMEETKTEGKLSGQAARKYYRALKSHV